MKVSNFKVGTRLSIGFGVLLLGSMLIGGISLWRLSQLDEVVTRLSTEDWERARLTMEMEMRTRDNAAKAARVLLDGIDAAGIEKLRAEMSANSKANGEALERLEVLVASDDAKALLADAAEARTQYITSRDEVNKLIVDPRTRAEALRRFQNETMPALESYVQPFTKLKELQQQVFEQSIEQSDAMYHSARNTQRAQHGRPGQRGHADRRCPAGFQVVAQHRASAAQCRGSGRCRQGGQARQLDRRGR
jgi:methyl-accepting chemotaxis protein